MSLILFLFYLGFARAESTQLDQERKKYVQQDQESKKRMWDKVDAKRSEADYADPPAKERCQLKSEEKQPILLTKPYKAGQVFKHCAHCPAMVMIPPGEFTMGGDDINTMNNPAHRVNIRYWFALGRYEVTQGEWQACVKAGFCHKPLTINQYASMAKKHDQSRDSYPLAINKHRCEQRAMNFVSWDDATAFVQWLRKKTGQYYRLPSEAEWEYAARAGTKTRYVWGDKFMPGRANCMTCNGLWSNKLPAPVASYLPNPWGLYDMFGNVEEWVEDDRWGGYEGAPSDGSVWCERQAHVCLSHRTRGGGYDSDDYRLLSAGAGMNLNPTVREQNLGFRVVVLVE